MKQDPIQQLQKMRDSSQPSEEVTDDYSYQKVQDIIPSRKTFQTKFNA